MKPEGHGLWHGRGSHLGHLVSIQHDESRCLLERIEDDDEQDAVILARPLRVGDENGLSHDAVVLGPDFAFSRDDVDLGDGGERGGVAVAVGHAVHEAVVLAQEARVDARKLERAAGEQCFRDGVDGGDVPGEGGGEMREREADDGGRGESG